MTEWMGWSLVRLPDETRILLSPDMRTVFCVGLETLEMLGHMFLDEVENAEELDDLREVLYG